MNPPQEHEVFAIRYGVKRDRQRHENFISSDVHDGSMPLDYFVWAIKNENHTIVVDTGFDQKEANKRGRELLRLPRDGLARIGVDVETVKDVVITHLHYDHAGTSGHFPHAHFHLQDLEMSFSTGRHMNHPVFSQAFSVEHVIDFVRHLYRGRVIFHSGYSQLAPGIELHHVGGHTEGLQVVRVFTKRGWIVLASDASHFYENMVKTAPFPIAFSVGDMVEGFRKMRDLADSDDHIVPGHDPLVMEYYPSPNRASEGIVVRLDIAPKR